MLHARLEGGSLGEESGGTIDVFFILFVIFGGINSTEVAQVLVLVL